MSTDTVDRGRAAEAVEYPDRVGFQPTNPYLAVFRPFIPAGAHLRELTPLPLIVGTLLGIVFGASSLYLVLKVGLTVSASIPVAVISITLFRLLSKVGLRDATILENNVVQTAGSAGESIAFGLGVTMPAIMILGFDLELTRVMLVAVLGGLLGILMMIPLRRALIVNQHGLLKYPEGTACAEVLKAGASRESLAAAHTDEASARVADEATTGGKIIFGGFGVGFLYYGLQRVFKLWNEEPTKEFGAPFERASVAIENNPALLGVGYIIGPRISSIMFGGGVLSYLVLIPMIHYFGSALAAPLAPATKAIGAMHIGEIQSNYVLYIGAGAVAAGGIISLLRSLPIIWHGLKGGLADLRGSRDIAESDVPRTDRDLSMKFVIGGIIVLVVTIMLFRALNMNLLGALLIVAFGFLFVTVSSRLTGEVGSSSNPISGMTVATLLLTCLVFLILGWTTPPYFVTALSVGAIVCIASSNGGTTSQDLKTGFLVGATPKAQQIAILVGALASALLLGPMLLQLNQGSTVYMPVAGHADFRFAPDFRVPPQALEQSGGAPKRERAQFKDDPTEYTVWHNTDAANGPAGRYLVNDQGQPVYLVDPGINGVYRKTVDGTSVDKFNAPKATLMSYIIKGILSRELPWGLVLLGVFIAVVLELAGIPSLAFAVGVYLPISASAPIFVGGMVRWLVDRYTRRKFSGRNYTEEQLVAEGDKSSGVLLASGYIAGAALAGVIYAFLNVKEDIRTWLGGWEAWATENNPLFAGPLSSLWAMVPFLLLALLLYAVGREWVFAGRRADAVTRDLR
ncbi:MAG TPA: oligopeptide transporter, OPT family [Pyrinomonadaceae bacterium]|nr:oligopeptide transporter, OPT family [Pyrinomonadaceae bacterium]